MQKADINRIKSMTREQTMKQRELMKEPINKFINERNEDGSLKFPVAEKMRNYEVAYPDAILRDIRMAKALFHETLWRKKQSERYLDNWRRETLVDMRDKEGRIMDKQDCYLAYLSETVNAESSISTLRSHLLANLLAKCDETIFSLEMFNDFVLDLMEKLDKERFDLFPTKIDMVKFE